MAISKLTGKALDLGTDAIESFASTGIDDNATNTAITISSAGNIGIGAAPGAGYLLDLQGTNRLAFDVDQTVGSNNEAVILTPTGGDSLRLRTSGSGYLAFNSGSTETVRIDTNGNVGIGETNPSDSKLHVYKNNDGEEVLARFQNRQNLSSSTAASISIQADQAEARIRVDRDGAGTSASLIFSTASAGTLGDRMIISPTGRVGIGTTPDTDVKLTVADSGTAFMRLRSTDASGDAIFQLGNATDSNQARVAFLGADESLNFYTSDAKRVTITDTGNVGIGTDDPQEKLEVDGSILATPVLYSSNQDAPYLIAGSQNYTGASTNWGTYGIQHRIKTDSGGTPRITVDTQLAGEVFSIINGGNVGIKNSTPQATLDAEASQILRCSSAGYSTFWPYYNTDPFAAGSYDRLELRFDTSNPIVYFNASGYSTAVHRRIAFQHGGVTKLSVDADGVKFNGDTAAANALDDYEEGTYTPRLYDAATGGNVSATIPSYAYYTKVGRLVTVNIYAWNNIDTTGLTAGNVVYIDLPFAAHTTGRHVGSVNTHGWTYAGPPGSRTVIMPQVVASATRLYFVANGNGASDLNVVVSDISSGADDIVTLSITYHTNS